MTSGSSTQYGGRLRTRGPEAPKRCASSPASSPRLAAAPTHSAIDSSSNQPKTPAQAITNTSSSFVGKPAPATYLYGLGGPSVQRANRRCAPFGERVADVKSAVQGTRCGHAVRVAVQFRVLGDVEAR